MKKYSVETDWGWVNVVFTEKGLYSSTLPQKSPEDRDFVLLPLSLPIPGDIPNIFLALELIRLYFHGEPVEFRRVKLDFSGYSLFSRKVFSNLRKVPYGGLISYKALARMSGFEKASRGVGAALRTNRFLILVPCHRVLKSDGGLGGFSLGLEWKRKLLFWESFVKETQSAH
ncbi:MAG: methylated-DNA--[protein]-cysteine S-methyltransferase [Caldiserica bacterium]|jgi:methylated-DNA-[protein]-cysteine S-methyltransferase|nr:methylated-DNA--[protein]-cysteine S-methyltransferase [Caldisericota bacterium]MDH7562733.1 methylated-DNA--[protein]-cysteine S-methyltransferase [Caldisericota bacterium]